MHYPCEVWFEDGILPDEEGLEEVRDRIHDILGPYQEESGTTRAKFWDWLEIGGRFTGRHDGYRAWEDPLNQSICTLCGGTGTRSDSIAKGTDMKGVRGCNGCLGTGVSRNFSNVPHKEDIMPVDQVRDGLTAYTLVIVKKNAKYPKILHEQKWDGKSFVKGTLQGTVKEELARLKLKGGTLVTVDYHS
jgi:hypothetical protein